MERSTPNPDFVGDLFWGIFKPQWIRLALTLDIFTPWSCLNESELEELASLASQLRDGLKISEE